MVIRLLVGLIEIEMFLGFVVLKNLVICVVVVLFLFGLLGWFGVGW